MKIGVLALQGAFLEHEKCFERLGAEYFEIRQAKDLEKEHDGIVIPGGESTVMSKLLGELGMSERIVDEINAGKPVFGTCAGLILLAKEIEGEEMQGIKTMDIVVKRNAYGRQLGSFSTKETFAGQTDIPMTFIRAPYIAETGKEVEVLSVVEGKIVAARQKNQLVTAFHPELTEDLTVHKYFLEMIADAK